MKQAGKGYVYGTAAKKLEYDVYEENKVLRAKKIRKNNSKDKLKMVCLMIMGFSMCFVLMYRYALITELNYNVYKLNSNYNSIKNDNSSLKLNIEKQLDLNTIKEIAEKKLGMQKPDKYQITYVNVPKQNYTRVSDEAKDAKRNDNIFTAALNKFSQLSKYLY